MPTPTAVFMALFALGPAVAVLAQPDPTAVQLYRARCATCHGESGHPDPATRKTTTPAYDFTRCSVAAAEPDTAWLVAVTKGGPAVGLSAEMPAFGGHLAAEQIRDVVTYLRRLCLDEGWPSGNLNLPRPILTEKAFPEDEVVVLPAISHGRRTPSEGELAAVIEKRFGKRNNLEIELPIASIDSGFGRQTGVGDVELAIKRVLFADRAGTRIVSAGLEVAFPTGDPARSLGEGSTRFAPFVAAGFPFGRSSLQTTIGLELPENQPWNDRVLEYNVYAGRDLTLDPKKWTVGVEVNGENGELAVTPQIRKAIVKTGALAAAVGVQVPITERDKQHTRIVGYVLWDYREPVWRR